VFNVIHGDGEIVSQLIRHPEVAAISFVGSTPVAESIYHQATESGKRVQALGGAKNHLVVLPDADLDQAVDALIGSAFGSAGERCMAVSVAVPVGEKLADALIERLRPRIQSLRVGPGDVRDSEMGPLVTRAHLERVRSYLDLGAKEGAQLIVDGREAVVPTEGFFLGGSLFDRVRSSMRIYREEIFGPILAVVRTQSLGEAIELVNQHEYGNGVAIFTRDGSAARAFARQVQIGMVGINVPIPVPMAFHSFGGWKRSLFGDHHVHGPEGVRFYTRLKTVTSRWPEEPVSAPQFVMPTAH
jgi:malonate-semialdehyde dehydrogenase (acetylating) / methylmalonate-semialdehyde dehydrogenase